MRDERTMRCAFCGAAADLEEWREEDCPPAMACVDEDACARRRALNLGIDYETGDDLSADLWDGVIDGVLTVIPDRLAERADGFYSASYWLHQGALGVDHATGADYLAGDLQDRACAIYAEFQS